MSSLIIVCGGAVHIMCIHEWAFLLINILIYYNLLGGARGRPFWSVTNCDQGDYSLLWSLYDTLHRLAWYSATNVWNTPDRHTPERGNNSDVMALPTKQTKTTVYSTVQWQKQERVDPLTGRIFVLFHSDDVWKHVFNACEHMSTTPSRFRFCKQSTSPVCTYV